MALTDKIKDDFVDALKTKNVSKPSVLRMLKSALHNYQIAEKKELSDNDVIKIVQKEIKQRKDSIATFETGGRAELAEKEKKEIEILSKYMPQQLSGDELTKIVQAAIAETGASGPADIGKVIGRVMPQVAGRADGGQVSTKVKEFISK